jgi:hypothetical protein
MAPRRAARAACPLLILVAAAAALAAAPLSVAAAGTDPPAASGLRAAGAAPAPPPRSALAAAAAAAPAASRTPPGRAFPGLAAAGPRRADDPATGMCACVDQGLNQATCFAAVTSYCEAPAAKPNMTLCSAMSDFLNRQDARAGREVARSLLRTCRAAVTRGASACACLEVKPLVRGAGPAAAGRGEAAGSVYAPGSPCDGPVPRPYQPSPHGTLQLRPPPQGYTTPGCRAAALGACAAGNTMCAALVFGSEAAPQVRACQLIASRTAQPTREAASFGPKLQRRARRPNGPSPFCPSPLAAPRASSPSTPLSSAPAARPSWRARSPWSSPASTAPHSRCARGGRFW